MADIRDPKGEISEDIADELRKAQMRALKVDGAIRKNVDRRLRQLEKEIVATIAEIDPGNVVQTAAKKRRLDALVKQVRELTQKRYQGISRSVDRDLTKLAGAERLTVQRSIGNAVASTGLDFKAGAFSESVVNQITSDALVNGAPHKEWWNQQSRATVSQFQNEMRVGLAAGEQLGQLVRRVRGGVSGGVPVQGIMDISRRSAERIVRTSTQAVINETRFKVYEENDDVLEGVKHLSTLDNRTSLQCIARDAKVWTLKKIPVGHSIPFQTPPVHWNCRSTLSPVVTGAPPGFPQNPSFDEWFKGQPGSVQNQMLGPTRAQLWRNGQLNLSETLDFRGQPLSVKQLLEADLFDTPTPLISQATAADTQAMFRADSGKWLPARVSSVHDPIVRSHFSGKAPVPVGQRPRFTMLGGGSGAGKGTIQKRGLVKTNKRTVSIDSDEIKKSIPEFNQLAKNGQPDLAAAFAHEESSFIAQKRIMKESRDKTFDTLLDGTGDNGIEKLRSKVGPFRKAGYRISGDYVSIPTEDAVNRSLERYRRAKRAGQVPRKIPEAYIRKVHAGVSKDFPRALEEGLFDEAKLWDNTGKDPILILEHKDGVTRVADSDLWESFKRKAFEDTSIERLTPGDFDVD